MHDNDNFSDNSPIIIQLNVPVSYGFNTPEPHRDTVMWHKVNITDLNNYRITMDNLLKCIDIPSCILSCNVLRVYRSESH